MDSSKTFTYFIKAQTGDLERGFRKSGQEAQQLERKLDKLGRSTLDVREASVRVERAQRSAARAVERFGKDSLQAAEAQIRLERAEERASRATTAATAGTRKHSSALVGAAKGAAGLGLAYFGTRGVLDALNSSVKASQEAEVSQTKMRTQLKASGISYRKHADEIERVIQKTSQLSGLDDEDLQDSFTNIVRVTGDVNKSLKLTGLAADFARAKHIDVAKAGEIVAKVAGGNTGILSRYGLSIKKGATATEALGILQKKFAGQAEAYGKTQAGSTDRLNVAMENLKEKIGGALAPVLTDAANKLADFVNGMTNGTGAGGRFVDKLNDIWAAAKPPLNTIKDLGGAVYDFAKRHPIVTKLAGAMAAVALAVKTIKFASKISGLSTFLSAARTGASTFKRIWANAGTSAADDLAANAKTGMNKQRGGLKSAAGTLGRGVGTAFKVGFVALGAIAAVEFTREFAPKLKSELEKSLPGPLKKLPGIGKWLAEKLPITKPLVKAAGGPIIGGTPGRDSVPALLMPGEHVWTTREVQAAGGHGAMYAMRRALGGGGQSRGPGMADGGAPGGTWSWARAFAQKYGLTITSSYRTPEHNRAVGGVPNSYHTRGSAANPQAFDFTPPSSVAAAAARRAGAAEVLIHNAGSGLHLHVGGPPASAAAVLGRAGGGSTPSGWQDGVCTWYKPSAGGINGREGAGAWAGHPIYDTTWGCAAPPAYAFGTLIEFRYNGKSVQVPVMDRGGAIQGTHFDLLPGPARALGMQGAGKVNVKFRVAGKASAAAVKAPKPMRSRGVQAKGVAGFGHTGKYFEKLREDREERAGTAMTTFLQGRDDAVEGAYQLATLTPGKDDDLSTAQTGLAYGNRLVASYAQRLRDGTASPSDLANAISYRDGWQTRIDDAKALDQSAVDLAALIQGLKDEQKATREFGERIVATTGGAVITGLIGQLASTGIGTSFNLANQSAGRGAGQHATY